MTTVIVGGGPAILGLLTAASPDQLDQLARTELVIVDAAPRASFGSGRLASYQVRSDTRARVFAECVAWAAPRLGSEGRRLLARCSTDDPVPLPVAARLLRLAGGELMDSLAAHPRVRVLDRRRPVALRPGGDGLALAGHSGRAGRALRAGPAGLGIGGAPRLPAGVTLDPAVDVHSDAVLRRPG